ncbi:MAG: DUF3047 domain-containing protein [Rhodothermales bacterium]|nr:DUF3047 domain-containing protein [Rhodothermales bacterium]
MKILPIILIVLCFGRYADPVRAQDPVIFENFESYEVGDTPYEWSTNKGRSLIPASPETMNDRHRYQIIREGGNKFVRAEMRNYAYRLIRLNENPSRWDLDTHPILQWDWRVHRVPAEAREDRKKSNDTAAAVYVTFGRDWLGRPKSIKYSFSSTLPVGTVISDGQLRILIVGSAASDALGEWRTIRRNVVEDYRHVFGGSPGSDRPIGITLFSDADDVQDDSSRVDFDNVILLSE